MTEYDTETEYTHIMFSLLKNHENEERLMSRLMTVEEDSSSFEYVPEYRDVVLGGGERSQLKDIVLIELSTRLTEQEYVEKAKNDELPSPLQERYDYLQEKYGAKKE